MQHGLKINNRRSYVYLDSKLPGDGYRHFRKFDRESIQEGIPLFLSSENPVRWYVDSTRELARTTMGNLGWIQNISKYGDHGCVFRGAPFPSVDREREQGFYTLIGDAYIQDIMHGEAWSDDDLDTVDD